MTEPEHNRSKDQMVSPVDAPQPTSHRTSIHADAIALMNGDESAAATWLETPLPILGNKSPLEHASTDIGALEVESLIGRLRQGVFS